MVTLFNDPMSCALLKPEHVGHCSSYIERDHLGDNILGLQLQMTVIAHSPIIFIKKISQYPFFW